MLKGQISAKDGHHNIPMLGLQVCGRMIIFSPIVIKKVTHVGGLFDSIIIINQ